MKFQEPAVLVDQEQMEVLERVANNAGYTGDDLVREVLRRVMDSLEQAQKAGELAHKKASHLRVVRSDLGCNNVVRLPLKR
ncbi:hypothetical protein [Pseudomonas sp. NA-150]|uniref:hypothetical protein n=1 Tax=Pseudomonas sp. NA-150 TaxID=3367525 RepID=UPI0037C7EF75